MARLDFAVPGLSLRTPFLGGRAFPSGAEALLPDGAILDPPCLQCPAPYLISALKYLLASPHGVKQFVSPTAFCRSLDFQRLLDYHRRLMALIWPRIAFAILITRFMANAERRAN